MLFCAIYKIWKQNLSLKSAIFDVVLPDVCQLCSRHNGKFVHTTDSEIIFWPNCSKFAGECDWNSENSPKVQNLKFFGKIDGFFEKNLEFVSKSIKVATFL